MLAESTVFRALPRDGDHRKKVRARSLCSCGAQEEIIRKWILQKEYIYRCDHWYQGNKVINGRVSECEESYLWGCYLSWQMSMSELFKEKGKTIP